VIVQHLREVIGVLAGDARVLAVDGLLAVGTVARGAGLRLLLAVVGAALGVGGKRKSAQEGEGDQVAGHGCGSVILIRRRTGTRRCPGCPARSSSRLARAWSDASDRHSCT